MPTSLEILGFLVKNSKPEYHPYPVSADKNLNDPEIGHIHPDERLEALLLRCSGTTRYLCEENALGAFLGEGVSFEKHLRPLIDLGICFTDVPKAGDFYDSASYRKAFDHATGRVTDYRTRTSWVAFHYRENNFLPHYNALTDDAERLGLFRGNKKKS
jgi:hypothetical protein